jgi:hypothetical protein
MAERLQAALRRPGPDLFVPLCFALARRMEQAYWSEMAEDPALAAFAIKSAEKVFLADGSINWSDSWLEAESAGLNCERDDEGKLSSAPAPLTDLPDADPTLQGQPLKNAIDVAARLCQQAGEQGLVMGYLNGPATVTRRLGAEASQAKDALQASAKIAVALSRAYCEAGVSALLIHEEEAVADIAAVEALAPVFNLAEYYGATVVYTARDPLPAVAKEWLARQRALVAGASDEIIALPIGTASVEDCAALWRAGRVDGRRRLVISGQDIPADTAPEDVIALAKMIKDG